MAQGDGVKTWADWEQVHQPYELRYHSEQGIAWCRDDERFTGFWQPILDFVGVKGECLDVGCGPRPPLGFGSWAIEPLADAYRTLCPEWWEGIQVVAGPAENLVIDFVGQFETVLCWNCLDHTIGWQQILANIASYGHAGTRFGFAMDFNPPSPGHPGFERAEFYAALGERFRILDERTDFQERQVALVCVHS